MTGTWTPKRLAGKNIHVIIDLRSAGHVADIWTEAPGEPGWCPYQVAGKSGMPFDGETTHTSMNADNIISTDERDVANTLVVRQHLPLRYMGEGIATGLESRRDHLSGRFTIAQAISLAVHLGASRIELHGTENVSARAFRNLETMVRPLKGHRVDVWDPAGNTPFAKESRK